MRSDERDVLRQRFQFRCGYCGVREIDAGAELTVDHFQPRAHDGLDEADNWVYCCHACNAFKGDYWQPDSVRRILHPLRDNLAEHIAERVDGMLFALTATGAFHIQKLRLNRAELVTYRLEHRLIEAARHVQVNILQRLTHLEQQVQALTERVERLGRGEPPSG
jgi:HNH endonuclease